MSEKEQCGATFVTNTSDESRACVREDAHVVHRDAGGNRFVRAPGGALVLSKKS